MPAPPPGVAPPSPPLAPGELCPNARAADARRLSSLESIVDSLTTDCEAKRQAMAMIRQLRRDALESDAATHDVVPEVAVADGVGGAVSGNALKAGKDAAIKADLGPTPPAAGDKTDPGDGASFKPRCPLPPDLIEVNGTVSVCTPSDAEGVLRRWAEIARSARRRLSASLPQLASMSVRVSIQQELRVPSAVPGAGELIGSEGSAARALLEKAAGSVCAALGPKWKGSTCVARRLSRGGQPRAAAPPSSGARCAARTPARATAPTPSARATIACST